MLTDDEVRLAGDALMLRASEQDRELWFRPQDELFPAAHELMTGGYLARGWDGDRMVFRATDEAMTAQALHAAVTTASENVN